MLADADPLAFHTSFQIDVDAMRGIDAHGKIVVLVWPPGLEIAPFSACPACPALPAFSTLATACLTTFTACMCLLACKSGRRYWDMIRSSTVSFGRLVRFNLICKFNQGFVTVDRGSAPALCRIAFEISTGHTTLDTMCARNCFIARVTRRSARTLVCAMVLFQRALMPVMCRSTVISYSPTVSERRLNIGGYGMPDSWSAIWMRWSF